MAPECNAISRQILIDTVETLSYQMLFDVVQTRDEKFELNKSVQYFKNLIEDQKSHGRLFLRHRLANIFAVCCLEDPYRREEEHEQEKVVVCLARWTPQQWEKLKRSLLRTRDKILREDAAWNDRESDKLDEQRSNTGNDLYHAKLDKILRLIPMQKALSEFRSTLEEQVRSRRNGNPKIEPDLIQEFVQTIEDDFKGDRMAQNALRQLVRSDERETVFSLAPLLELRDYLQVKPFSLHKFQKYLTDLLRSWSDDLFGTEAPELIALGSNREVQTETSGSVDSSLKRKKRKRVAATEVDVSALESAVSSAHSKARAARKSLGKRKAQDQQDEEEVKAELENLKNVRTTLKGDVDDPLEQSCKIAAQAVANKSSTKPSAKKKSNLSMNDKKPSAKALIFDDSDEDSEYEGEDEEGVKLSALPGKATVKSPSNKKRVPPELDHFDEFGKKKRRRFTEEEKEAIREGVRTYSVGQWAKIKAHFPEVLRNRTSVNIKDCYRTMMKNGEAGKAKTA